MAQAWRTYIHKVHHALNERLEQAYARSEPHFCSTYKETNPVTGAEITSIDYMYMLPEMLQINLTTMTARKIRRTVTVG